MSRTIVWWIIGIGVLCDLLLCGVFGRNVWYFAALVFYCIALNWEWPGWATEAERKHRCYSLVALTVLALIPTNAGNLIIPVLLFGWIPFLGRTLPRVAFEPVPIVAALTCLIALALGIPFLGRAFSDAAGTENRPRQSWQFRWTVALVFGVVLLFVTGLAAVGIVESGRAIWALRNEHSGMTP